jgi:NADH-quinone oxidoreductase subunit G
MRHDLGTMRPEAVFNEISKSVHGYNVPFAILQTGSPVPSMPVNGGFDFPSNPALIRSARNTLYTSGTLGRFSEMLNSVMESPGELYRDPLKDTGIREGSVQLETQTRDK